jgi:hypothetical protein
MICVGNANPAAICYKWYKDSIQVVVQTNTYTVTSASATTNGIYNCVVTNSDGDSVKSNGALVDLRKSLLIFVLYATKICAFSMKL